jgi:hypothetical protein
LPENVVHGIGSGRLRPSNQCFPKANILDFGGLNSVTCYVINSICRPDEFVNLHSAILDEWSARNNESGSVLSKTASIARAAAQDPAPAQ